MFKIYVASQRKKSKISPTYHCTVKLSALGSLLNSLRPLLSYGSPSLHPGLPQNIVLILLRCWESRVDCCCCSVTSTTALHHISSSERWPAK